MCTDVLCISYSNFHVLGCVLMLEHGHEEQYTTLTNNVVQGKMNLYETAGEY